MVCSLPGFHFWVCNRKPFANIWQWVIVQRRRFWGINFFTQLLQLIICENLFKDSSSSIWGTSYEPLIIKAMAIHTKPCVLNSTSAKEFNSKCWTQRSYLNKIMKLLSWNIILINFIEKTKKCKAAVETLQLSQVVLHLLQEKQLYCLLSQCKQHSPSENLRGKLTFSFVTFHHLLSLRQKINTPKQIFLCSRPKS